MQISPSICVVADDEYDRNHLSPSHVLLQLLNTELLREIIRKTPPRTPRCVSRKSPRPIDGDLCSQSDCDAYVCWRLLWGCSKSPRKAAAAARLRGSIRVCPAKRAQEPYCCAPACWRHDTATPRHEHQVFEGKGSLECGHVGAPRACIEIAYKPRTVAYPDVRAGRSPFTFPDRDHSTGCESSMVYPPGLENTDGRTVHSRSVRESMS